RPLPAPVSSSSPPSMVNSTLRRDALREFLMTEVDPDLRRARLDVVSFSAVFVWCAFQTGNTLQLSIALARLFQGPQVTRYFFSYCRQASTHLLDDLHFRCFLGRIGDRIGAKTRLWLFLGTIFQSLLTMGGAIALWQSHQGSVASSRDCSMGLQGIMGKRVNTQFTTTIVLTTVWCELMGDPKLFVARPVTTRDHKMIAIAALFIGGFCSRAILQAIGSPASLGIGAGYASSSL
ncbi:hypothetical protein EI94DRAFT_1715685, partial [Lactarius quietus]